METKSDATSLKGKERDSEDADTGSASGNDTQAVVAPVKAPEPIAAIHTGGIREDMVQTAVTFLRNPRVQQSPISKRTAFLKQKGLSDDEVHEALRRTGDSVPTDATRINALQPQAAAHAHTHAQSGHNAVVVPQSDSLATRLKDTLFAAIVIGGVGYGLSSWIGAHILPRLRKWLSGDSDERLERMELAILALKDSLGETGVCVCV
eukprot:Opistho-2@80017